MTPSTFRNMAGRAGTRGSHSDPTRVGQARPSQLVTTTGVGPVADLPAMSVIVRGLDAWAPERQETIDEPRLLAEVRRTLGAQARALRTAPWDPDADSDPWTRVGVPVTPFPRWVRCPACYRLGVLDGSDFTLVHRFGRRPDLAKFVHRHCPKQNQRREANRRACIPARFVVVCDDGHLDDFPYVEFVHHGGQGLCGGPQLTMSDAASTLSPRVTITCVEYGPNQVVVQAIIDQVDGLRTLRGVPIEDVWKAIEALRDAGGPTPESDQDNLLDAEWALLSRPTTEKQDRDFKAVPTRVPQGYGALLDQVVQVSRLREVQALVGFTRTSSPERRVLDPRGRISLSRGPEQWVPAVEQRGEGIFLELHETAVSQWADRVREHPRILALRSAYGRWGRNRDQDSNPEFPIARYLLLHTLSHLLIRQVSLECGYSSASIRERLYIGTPAQPAAGVLLSTAASDSEGTLGGLVALGEARHLGRLLDGAFEDASRCSSDPLCAEHEPRGLSDSLHAAACHACLFASETSCETNNRWLDRSVLVDLTGDGLAFPR